MLKHKVIYRENTVGQVGSVYFARDGLLCALITVSDAAEILGYSEQHIRRLCDEGKLIAIKIGRFWLIERPSLDYVRQQLDEIPF